MSVSNQALGMNARNYLYIRPYNKKKAKSRADNKLFTKQKLIKAGIPCPNLLAVFTGYDDARHFDWTGLPDSFVIKPARGYAGGGILLVRDWDGSQGTGPGGSTYTIADIESHIFDIVDGSYSLRSIPDQAFIESRLIPNRFLKKIPYNGIPDIRIIVFSGVPVMAMVRVPTEGSGGKANISQGALAIGIDISTGITTEGWYRNFPIRNYPGTKIKLHGIRIPHWDDILTIATSAQKTSRLGFAGIDIVIDKNLGPVVLEINARPGLEIQNVNRTSLRTRLERVTDITPSPTVTRGIEIAKSLFAESFSDKVSTNTSGAEHDIIGVVEPVSIKHAQGEENIFAKVDTGAFRSSIDIELAEKLGLPESGEQVRVRSASGRQHRDTVELTFRLKNKTIKTQASIIDRGHLNYPMIVGRRDMDGFLVDPSTQISPELSD